ncbi:hypothetical protein WR25_01923 [Diploscapter pachys]|uniref:Uncharacterized protein n=1 Tax=Diploscapter pachys TaxID=2018661 RepID=A0A2A2M621_9BILA|nr:hypothetical protein WR25_01923 [Diploscapter pachys]
MALRIRAALPAFKSPSISVSVVRCRMQPCSTDSSLNARLKGTSGSTRKHSRNVETPAVAKRSGCSLMAAPPATWRGPSGSSAAG